MRLKDSGAMLNLKMQAEVAEMTTTLDAPTCRVMPTLSCDWCGSEDVILDRCKVACRTCRRISASCADL